MVVLPIVRRLFNSPWHAATSIGTIALTIALGATVFAVVDGVLFKPLPYPSAERLLALDGSGGPGEGTASLAPRDVEYLNEADPRISVTGYGAGRNVTPIDHPDMTIGAASIDRRFFEVLVQRPLIGGFSENHFAASIEGVPTPVIVSHAFWRQWLGADPAALGRSLDVVGGRLQIVGVLPSDFVFPYISGLRKPDVLFPLVLPPRMATDRWNRSLTAIARLQAGIALEEAATKLNAALSAHVDEYPPQPRNRPGPYTAVRARSLVTMLGRGERPLFGLAFGCSALLILLGAINVTGLFAARVHDRARELAIRTALGATERQLVALLISETAAIAIAGGALGSLLAPPLLNGALRMLPASVSLLKAPGIDGRVIAFATLAAVIPVVVCALIPAVSATRDTLTAHVTSTANSTVRTRTWGRNALLAAEGAIGIALVVPGSLLLASFIVLRSEDAGVDTARLAVMETTLTSSVTPIERAADEARVMERIRQVPGVAGVAMIRIPLLANLYAGSQFKFPTGAVRFFPSDIPVTGSFFEVSGLRLLDGRLPAAEELDAGRPVAVVSEGIARAYWPTGRAVGEQLESSAGPPITVVGVVKDARLGSQSDIKFGQIYVPASPSRAGFGAYLIKTAGDPERIVRNVTLALQRDAPGVLVRRAESFDSALSNSVQLHRFRTILLTLAAGAGLLLLGVGIAGLVATSATRRVRELGIRAALGAERGELVTMLVVDHLRPVLVGLLAGLLVSWWTTRLFGAFLYAIDAREPLVWLSATFVLLSVAIVAAWLPGRRAGRVDPIVLLRTE